MEALRRYGGSAKIMDIVEMHLYIHELRKEEVIVQIVIMGALNYLFLDVLIFIISSYFTFFKIEILSIGLQLL